MRMNEIVMNDSFQEILFVPPDFSHYNGGHTFIFNNKVFHRKNKSLGRGAYGEVFCFEASDNTKVAVKVEHSQNHEYWDGAIFQKEAMWYQKIYGLGVFSGNPNDEESPHYILMPYFEGKTLDKLSYTSTQDLLFYWIKTADAVQTLHTKHLAVHGDLKLDNIMANEDKKIFAIDFSLMMGPKEKRLTSLLDTPWSRMRFRQYPPEAFSNRAKLIMAHPTQDIYALGILLYDLFSHFLETNLFSQPASGTTDTIIDVQKNLTQENPYQRWPIAKAIYMLTITFFSKIPRHIWILHAPDDNKLVGLNHTNLMQTLWRETSTIAIAMRITELLDEQEDLNEKSPRKTQKIEGLRALHSEIIIKNPEQFGVIVSETKKTFPELTAGVFSRRTKTLVDELSHAAPVFL